MPKYDRVNNPIPKEARRENTNIVFSFERLQFNEYFNIDCACSNWFSDLMNMMQSISSVSLIRFKTDSGFRNSTYRIHNLKNANPPVTFPANLKDSEQIRIRISTKIT